MKQTKELSIKYQIAEKLYLDQPTNREREETAEKICELLKKRFLGEKLVHNHKNKEEEYECGCGWFNDAIDEICADLDYKKKWIKVMFL